MSHPERCGKIPSSLQIAAVIGVFAWPRLRLHRKAPQCVHLRGWDEVPAFARVAYPLALLLLLRVALAIKRSGRL